MRNKLIEDENEDEEESLRKLRKLWWIVVQSRNPGQRGTNAEYAEYGE